MLCSWKRLLNDIQQNASKRYKHLVRSALTLKPGSGWNIHGHRILDWLDWHRAVGQAHGQQSTPRTSGSNTGHRPSASPSGSAWRWAWCTCPRPGGSSHCGTPWGWPGHPLCSWPLCVGCNLWWKKAHHLKNIEGRCEKHLKVIKILSDKTLKNISESHSRQTM